MKSAIVALTLLASVLGDERAVRPGQGALLVLPQGQAAAQRQESLQELGERVAERLREQQGSEDGDYHVYLADGRLQRVQYTAAPLTPFRQQDNQPTNQFQSSSNVRVNEPNPIVAHFGRLQQEKLQQQLNQLQRQQEELRQEEERLEQQLRQQQQFASNYVATIRFSDVPPIPAPIYSQSPAPITRILRQAVY